MTQLFSASPLMIDDHIESLCEVFHRPRSSPKNYSFVKKYVQYFRRSVSGKRIADDYKKTKIVNAWSIPAEKLELKNV